MGEIQCLACDKTLELPQYIDTDNYDGQVVCHECNSLLHVKLVRDKLRKYKIVENKREPDVQIILEPPHSKEPEGEEKELKQI